MKGKRCDICGFKDSHEQLTMIHCDKCGLAVHKECYGFTLYTLKTFTCWACQAVGRSFEIEDRDELGNRRRILQRSRPTKCALCSVSDGTHAMHPLYDRAGPGGRQIYNDGGLAWAHTLCAFVLNTKSYLFGCSRDGNYDAIGESEEDTEIDDRSENSELMDETQEGDEFGNSVPVHHFVYIGLNNNNKESQKLYRGLKKIRSLICTICGADDKPEGVLRICVQCNANDENEYSEFRGKHPSLSNDETCTAALHVGCSRWGGSNPFDVQRVYYFPGSEHRDPVVTMYCSLHAADVDQKYQKKKKLLEERRQTEQERENSTQRLEQSRKPPQVPRKNRDNSLHTSILDDLIEKVGNIQDIKRRQEAFTNRKQYWKKTLKSLTPEQFSEVWKIAKKSLSEYIKKGNTIQRQVSQADAAQRHMTRVVEAQRQISHVIATHKKQSPRTVEESAAKRKRSQVDRSNPVGKRKKTEPNGDPNDGEFEFEAIEENNEADQQQNATAESAAEKSEGQDSEPFSFVSGLCHPLPKGCMCSKTELLSPWKFRCPPPRTQPIDGFGRWDLG